MQTNNKQFWKIRPPRFEPAKLERVIVKRMFSRCLDVISFPFVWQEFVGWPASGSPMLQVTAPPSFRHYDKSWSRLIAEYALRSDGWWLCFLLHFIVAKLGRQQQQRQQQQQEQQQQRQQQIHQTLNPKPNTKPKPKTANMATSTYKFVPNYGKSNIKFASHQCHCFRHCLCTIMHVLVERDSD